HPNCVLRQMPAHRFPFRSTRGTPPQKPPESRAACSLLTVDPQPDLQNRVAKSRSLARHQLLQRPAGLPEIFLQGLYPSRDSASPVRERLKPSADYSDRSVSSV